MGELVNIKKNELINAVHNGELPDIKPFQKEIFLINTHIAGMFYTADYDDIIDEIEDGDRLTMIREPENEHDELAILLFDEKNRKVGYVPRIRNPVLARLMDAGKYLYAVVVDDDEDGWRIDIYMED